MARVICGPPLASGPVSRESRGEKIDRFGLGSWWPWPRPEQAAAGALDHLPTEQWPELAAKWRAAGFDSPLLRQLAEFKIPPSASGSSARNRTGSWAAPRGLVLSDQPGAIHARFAAMRQARDLMPEVLRSIGFAPVAADEAFVARCQNALDVVQHDLDVTGYGQYRMRARFGDGWPAGVYPAMADGSYWGGTQGMGREEDGSGLLWHVASLVSATLKEIPEIEWPVCAIHGGHPGSIWDGEDPADRIKKVAWWRCTNTGHPLAPVGQLTAEIAKTL
jgi:hypothetical protein